ncbi:MAG: tRNA (adenosine(37)-N6)-threonylcarbamoyltransferase complex dimerization subunit type 1 TsaB [Rhodocyclaceae bacterium]|jgi:tRNA threonylcarbamoyladenosine biosynthesis protein TsaB|nr:MAG: tRNA (adenosine(37)-N6)-threonylcarbamoyltransferase complex dimerization subunit type 1 TsaB [Rhodocyclaceae bacterium]
MTVILAIETSAEAGSVALLRGDTPLERNAPAGTPHSGWVLPAIYALLAEAGTGLAGVDAIAFGAGPGSFTGLRLACGIAQGLALGADLPVVAACSLEAIALAAGPGDVWVGIDARMREMYFAAYAVDADEVRTLIEPACAAPELVQAPESGRWNMAGSAFQTYAELLVPRFAPVTATMRPELAATAGWIARIGAREFSSGRAVDPALAAPLYVRDKVALTTAERLARGGRA